MVGRNSARATTFKKLSVFKNIRIIDAGKVVLLEINYILYDIDPCHNITNSNAIKLTNIFPTTIGTVTTTVWYISL